LTASGAGARVELGREPLLELFVWTLRGAGELHGDMEIAVLAAVAGAQPVDAFGLRGGQWRIDVRARVAQSAVAAALLGGAMAATGTSSSTVAVLALVLLFLVDV
jgi:hypothetical protein